MGDVEKDELEALKDAFIVSTSYEEKDLKDQLRRLIEYATIDKEGQVRIKAKNLTQRQQVLLVLVSRFIANKLNDSIPADVGIEDIRKSVKDVADNVIAARLTDENSRDYVIKLGRGRYQIRPIKIQELLDELGGVKESQ